ncbi:MAG: cysteine--tRNA ligase [Desulfurococcaceae archaeon]
MPEIRIYDTLDRDLRPLRPREPGTVKIYVCGPTVYDYSHLGHGRTYVVYDALKRYLKIRGYHVVHVMNITDIDDKIINRARDEGRDWREIAETYTRDYLEVLARLGVAVDHHPRVTDHIGEIIKFIEVLIDRGYAYVAPSGSVYFEVDKYERYGQLSNRTERALWSQEPEFVSEKKAPYDFALWKAAKPGEPYWESPWGKGRPGWHIECSVMSSRYLGGAFDIHGGGTDLIFPHHENERAQSEAALGLDRWVGIWMHTGMVTVGKDKMSKSLGNIVPLREALSKWRPGTLRLWYLATHYRKPLDFSEESIQQADVLRERVERAADLLARLEREARDLHYLKDEDLEVLGKLLAIRRKFHDEMSNDVNTPGALAALNELLALTFREIQYNPKYMLVTTARKLLAEFDQVFGVIPEGPAIVPEAGPAYDRLVDLLVSVRRELRARGLYELADRIRGELAKEGIILLDKGLETTWLRAKKEANA